MQHCPVDSISVAGFKQSKTISASDGEEKQICSVKQKTTRVNMFQQPLWAALRSVQSFGALLKSPQ